MKNKLLPYLRYFFNWFKFNLFYKIFQKKYTIIARHACLGKDVLKLLEMDTNILNIQKGRIDYILDCNKNPKLKANTLGVIPHMKRTEILSCINELEFLYNWESLKNPKILFMDSMAELADQRFYNRINGRSFLCSYSDLNHTIEFNNIYRNEGLIPLDQLEMYFQNFFSFVRENYGDIIILYLHFPSKLETRIKFIERANRIKEILKMHEQTNKNLFSISVNNSIVDWDKNRTIEMYDFPYHYNNDTYMAFSDEIRRILQNIN
jgi:hypothetical protein